MHEGVVMGSFEEFLGFRSPQGFYLVTDRFLKGTKMVTENLMLYRFQVGSSLSPQDELAQVN